MVATAPGETLLIGRRPVRTLTRRTISSLFLCRKLHLFLGNQQKLLLPELHFLTPICIKSFVGWGFSPHPTGRAYSAPPDTLGVFRGPTSRKRRGRKGEEKEREEGRETREEEMRKGDRGGEGREFVFCPRKKKEKSSPMHACQRSDLLRTCSRQLPYVVSPLSDRVNVDMVSNITRKLLWFKMTKTLIAV